MGTASFSKASKRDMAVRVSIEEGVMGMGYTVSVLYCDGWMDVCSIWICINVLLFISVYGWILLLDCCQHHR
jgi:hypothetical protein